MPQTGKLCLHYASIKFDKNDRKWAWKLNEFFYVIMVNFTRSFLWPIMYIYVHCSGAGDKHFHIRSDPVAVNKQNFSFRFSSEQFLSPPTKAVRRKLVRRRSAKALRGSSFRSISEESLVHSHVRRRENCQETANSDVATLRCQWRADN